jgi:hypothetical protein
MRRGITHFEKISYHRVCVGSTRHQEVIQRILWCIRHEYWRRINVKWSCNWLCFMTAQTPWRALPHLLPRALGCHSCIESLEALSLGKSSPYLHGSQESEISIHSAWLEHETMKLTRINQGLWVWSILSSWKGKCGCRRSKPQAPMQPSHNPTSHFLLWSGRAESLNCSTWDWTTYLSFQLSRKMSSLLKEWMLEWVISTED